MIAQKLQESQRYLTLYMTKVLEEINNNKPEDNYGLWTVYYCLEEKRDKIGWKLERHFEINN